jgi:outer membrane protein OmpA-like peptidoglycan-associated protein
VKRLSPKDTMKTNTIPKLLCAFAIAAFACASANAESYPRVSQPQIWAQSAQFANKSLKADLYFKPGSHQLDAASEAAIADLIAQARATGGQAVLITSTGYADIHGGADYNDILGEDRAFEAVGHLSRAFPWTPYAVHSLGKDMPSVDCRKHGNSSACLAPDRRVEVSIMLQVPGL